MISNFVSSAIALLFHLHRHFQYLKNQPETVANGGKIKTDSVKVPAGSKACIVM